VKEVIALNAAVKDILEFASIQRYSTKPNDAEIKNVP